MRHGDVGIVLLCFAALLVVGMRGWQLFERPAMTEGEVLREYWPVWVVAAAMAIIANVLFWKENGK